VAWSAPMTAVNGSPFTAAQFNQYVRDNLLETVPAKITGAGQYPVGTAANTIAVRSVSSSTVATQQSTTNMTSYGDLATVGPTVTVTTGTSALVYVTCQVADTSLGRADFVDFAITGASSRTAIDDTAARFEQDTNEFQRYTAVTHVTGLTAGSNIFTMKYKVASASTSTANFMHRHLIVYPL
jgi:hypothetical protein